jgi:methionyl aminopeptidase
MLNESYTYVPAADASRRESGQIKLYGPEAREGMMAAGQLSARALDMLAGEVRAGVTTEHLDDLVRTFILDHGGLPATLFYKGYTHSSCISLNHVVCHGIPGARVLREGDMLNIDVTALVDGWHGDTSRMYAVPPVKRRVERLMDVTFEAMWKGIEQVRPGARMGDIGAAIQRHAEAQRMSVVRDMVGHGVGRVFHDNPNVFHYGKAGTGPEMRPGMIFTIEPMVNLGKPGLTILPDGWTAVTRDREPSAQFEHSVMVTEDGYEVFTRSPAGLDRPYTLHTAS